MRIDIRIDVDVKESGFSSEDEIKDNLVDFTRDLLNNGAENQGIGYTLCEVDYYQTVNVNKDFNNSSRYEPKEYIKERLLNEKTFYAAILTIKDNIEAFNIIIDDPAAKNFHNDVYKFILQHLIKYVDDNNIQFICVNDLYKTLHNKDFYNYILVEFNNGIDCLEWKLKY